MAATCNGCGRCCEEIHLPISPLTIQRWKDAPDPRATPQWWGEGCWDMQEVFREWDGENSVKANAGFLYRYWHLLRVHTDEGDDFGSGDYVYQCAAFDSETRSCMVYEDRPPVCRGFPWYGHEPRGLGTRLHDECSYWEDIDADKRPEGWVKITAVQIRRRIRAATLV